MFLNKNKFQTTNKNYKKLKFVTTVKVLKQVPHIYSNIHFLNNFFLFYSFQALLY